MSHYREKAAVHRNVNNGAKTACMSPVLQNVQLWKRLLPGEVHQEYKKSLHFSILSGVHQCHRTVSHPLKVKKMMAVMSTAWRVTFTFPILLCVTVARIVIWTETLAL